MLILSLQGYEMDFINKKPFIRIFFFYGFYIYKHAFSNQPYEIKRQDSAEQNPLIALFHRSSKFLCHHFYCGYPTSVSVAPSPPRNHTHFPFRAASHRAVLYSFDNFSQRLVPSHIDPYHAPLQRGASSKKERYIFPLS